MLIVTRFLSAYGMVIEAAAIGAAGYAAIKAPIKKKKERIPAVVQLERKFRS